jgi:hypothetical protein
MRQVDTDAGSTLDVRATEGAGAMIDTIHSTLTALVVAVIRACDGTANA